MKEATVGSVDEADARQRQASRESSPGPKPRACRPRQTARSRRTCRRLCLVLRASTGGICCAEDHRTRSLTDASRQERPPDASLEQFLGPMLGVGAISFLGAMIVAADRLGLWSWVVHALLVLAVATLSPAFQPVGMAVHAGLAS